jgi:hypothetical protein
MQLSIQYTKIGNPHTDFQNYGKRPVLLAPSQPFMPNAHMLPESPFEKVAEGNKRR